VQVFLPATSLGKIDFKISVLLHRGMRVHLFHLLAALGKSVSRDAGRWDTEIVHYLPIGIGRLGTKSLLKRPIFRSIVFASPRILVGRSLEEDKCSDVTRSTRFGLKPLDSLSTLNG
jgi:hypothetical protein